MRRYGEWAGNPRGTPEDPQCCIAEVPMGGGSVLFRQCSRRRHHSAPGYHEALCWTHAQQLIAGLHVSIPDEGK